MTAPAPAPAPYGYQQPQSAPLTPAQQTGLGHALRSEWTKIRTVRSTMWTLGVMLVLVIGISMLSAAGMSHSDDPSIPVLSPGLFGLLLGHLAIITLGVLVITSEYGTGMIRTTFTACPSRSRVLTAKAIVFFVVSFTTTTAACVLTALFSYATMSGKAVSVDDTDVAGIVVKDGRTTAGSAQWLGATLGAGLYVALLGLLALAVGTLLRHSAGAITTMLGVVLLPILIAVFLPASMHAVTHALVKYSAPNGLATLYHIPMIGSAGQNGILQVGFLAGVTAVALGAAYAALNSRDV